MNISKQNIADIYDENGQRIVNYVTEDIALSEELRFKPSGTRINSVGENYFDEGRLWGFDVETAEYYKLISYFSDVRVGKRSPSLISYTLRKIAVRFPVEFSRDKKKLFNQIVEFNPLFDLTEFELIESHATNDPVFFGSAGVEGGVLFNGKLTKKNSKTIKTKHDKFEVKRR